MQSLDIFFSLDIREKILTDVPVLVLIIDLFLHLEEKSKSSYRSKNYIEQQM